MFVLLLGCYGNNNVNITLFWIILNGCVQGDLTGDNRVVMVYPMFTMLSIDDVTAVTGELGG